MAAKLATPDDHVLAFGKESGAIPDGSVTFSRADEKLQVDRLQFDCGYLSPFFITDPERMEVVFENVYILIHQGTITSRKDMLPLLEKITKHGKPLLIVAENVEGEALANLVVNKLSGLQVAAVSALGLGDRSKSWLQDITLLTGGTPVMEGPGIQLTNIHISDLGQAKKVTIAKNRMVIESRAKYQQLLLPEPLKSSTGVGHGQIYDFHCVDPS